MVESKALAIVPERDNQLLSEIPKAIYEKNCTDISPHAPISDEQPAKDMIRTFGDPQAPPLIVAERPVLIHHTTAPTDSDFFLSETVLVQKKSSADSQPIPSHDIHPRNKPRHTVDSVINTGVLAIGVVVAVSSAVSELMKTKQKNNH